MAILSLSDRLTAVELIKRGGFTDDQRAIIEVMSTTNELLHDAPVIQANEGTTHTHVVRNSLPHGQHRAYNQGVKTTASATKTVHDVIAELGAYSEIDVRLAQHAPNTQEFLTNEAVAFIEGLGQDQAEDFVYGNHGADGATIDGFATRRPKIDNKLCLDAGGTGNNLTSIYLVKWGHNGTKYIIPRGASGMAITRDNRGIQDVEVYDEAGKPTGKMRAYVNYFGVEYGLSVADERTLIRIANIDIDKTNGTELVKLIMKAVNKMPTGAGSISLACNGDVKTMFDIAAMEKNNVVMNISDPWGANITQVCNARLRRVDAILNTESRVVA